MTKTKVATDESAWRAQNSGFDQGAVCTALRNDSDLAHIRRFHPGIAYISDHLLREPTNCGVLDRVWKKRGLS